LTFQSLASSERRSRENKIKIEPTITFFLPRTRSLLNKSKEKERGGETCEKETQSIICGSEMD
jgi:hypothetical protein